MNIAKRYLLLIICIVISFGYQTSSASAQAGPSPGAQYISSPRLSVLMNLDDHVRFLRNNIDASVIWHVRHGAEEFTNAPSTQGQSQQIRGIGQPKLSPTGLISQPPGCATGSGLPAPLSALVSSLKCDPDLIFEYVYNNIEFEPMYGSNKGALGTLLDQRGDDADQAILLTTLLNAAGYTGTQYAWSTIRLTGTEITNWLGVPNDGDAIESLLDAGGIDYPVVSLNGDGTVNYIDVGHYVVQLNLGGAYYYFDPSFKPHTILTGLPNLASVLGYSQSQFLGDAGGIIDSISISSVNRSAMRIDLTNYASNLVNYIAQNNRTASLGNILGGMTIQPLVGSPIRLTAFPNQSPATPYVDYYTSFPTPCPGTSVVCRTSLSVVMPSATTAQAIPLFMDQVYGHRVTVFSTPSGVNYIPTLLIDGAIPSCVSGGSCTNVGPAVAAGTAWSIIVGVTQPNGYTGATGCPAGLTAEICQYLTVGAGGSYLISTSVGQVGRSMAEYHRQLAASAAASGGISSAEAVLGENLAAISYGWLAECSSEMRITGRLAQTTNIYNFGIGITGQAPIQNTGESAPYVDLPLNLAYFQPLTSSGPVTAIGSYVYPTAFVSSGFTHSAMGSSFESAILEQTQAPIGGAIAASTVRILDANMDPSNGGYLGRTFFADGTTPTGQSVYTSTIKPLINSHYSATDLTNISSFVAAGQQVVIPVNGEVSFGLWTGGGYSTINPQSGDVVLLQLITGGMAGGFFGQLDDPDSLLSAMIVTMSIGANDPNISPLLAEVPSSFDVFEGEPVDAITGAEVSSKTDLVTGSGPFPYSLPLVRTYQSAAGTFLTSQVADIGAGNGWAHSFDLSSRVDSDPYITMPPSDALAVTSAASIAALYVMQDLLAATPNAQTMTISAMVAHWLTDQQTGNIVLISKPNTTEEFVALPHVDGSPTVTYTAPPLSTVRLSQSLAGQITYLTKDGETLLFGPTPTGALQSWTFPNGMAVNLSYLFGPQLSVVTNSLGRSLTFSYNGNDVSSVTDDTGRSVAYGYDGNHNLVQATDPLGNTTNYVYDSSGMFDTQGHLTQIFNPSCPSYPFVTTWYDPLGRVNQQANGNGYSWSFYFAGSRSEIDDAVGNSHVTYQTDRGRVLLDARVLSGTADVFNDTVQQNGIVNVTTNQYDGLDRLTLTTLPEGGTTAFSYAGAVNPWANNIASIVSTAKPGSSLAPRTVSYTYDPVWNEATSVTDPLGLVATAAYDPATRNLLTAVADTASATAFNATSSFTYDAYGKPLSATDPLGIVTTFGYDAFENLVSQVVDSGAGHLNIRSQFGYDTLGNQIFQTDPNGNTTTMSYDANRRLVSMTAPAPYNGGAGLTQVTNGYDADGNVISIARANGTGSVVTRKTYSASSKLLSVTDPNGNTTMMSYDADDRIAGMIDPLFRTTSFSYDAMSRLVSTTNLAIQSTPLEQRSYSPDGLLASLTDANNHSTSYAYDGFDRLGTATYPDSSTEILGYDADSNILSFETRRSDTITFGYDTLNRRVTKTPPTPSPVVTYAWDLDGRPVGVSDTSASMTAVAAPGGTTAQYATATSYDQLNRPIGVTWTPAPTRTTPTASTVTFNHTYDATSRRIGQTANDNSYWSYPTSANAISYTTNNLSQYSAIGSVTPTYDGDGNLTYDGTFTYGYDSESRLTSLTGGGISGAYVYDAQGRRKEKTIGSTTTVYTTDAAGREILEYNGTTGAVQTWYAYGRGSNDVLNQMNVVAATRATLVPDIQGSIIASLPSGSTTPTKTGYQAYGENPSLTSGTFAYTAQRFDPETAGSTAEPSGLYYYRARMYSPSLGRFFQIDPIGYGGGGNLYAYVGNNPLNFVDPSGLVAQPGSGGGAVLGATAGIGHNGGPPLEEGIAEGESAAGAEAAELGLGIGLKAAAVAGIIVGAIVDPQTANQSENEFLSNWHANYATAYNFYINSGLSAADAQSHILGINLSLPVTVVSLPGGTPLIQYQTPGYAIGSYFASPGTPVNTLGIDPVGRVGINYVTSTNVQALQSTAAMTTGNPGLPSFAQGPGGGTQYYIPSKSVTPVN